MMMESDEDSSEIEEVPLPKKLKKQPKVKSKTVRLEYPSRSYKNISESDDETESKYVESLDAKIFSELFDDSIEEGLLQTSM